MLISVPDRALTGRLEVNLLANSSRPMIKIKTITELEHAEEKRSLMVNKLNALKKKQMIIKDRNLNIRTEEKTIRPSMSRVLLATTNILVSGMGWWISRSHFFSPDRAL